MAGLTGLVTQCYKERRTERPEKEEDLEDLERFQGGSKACEKVNE